MRKYEEYDDQEDFNDFDDSSFDDTDEGMDDLFDEDEEESSPVTGEDALYFDMIQKLYATLEEYGDRDPTLVLLQASLMKLAADENEPDESTYYLEEAITVAQHVKKYAKDSPNIKRIYDNLMLDIVRFTDESAPGHQGEYYL